MPKPTKLPAKVLESQRINEKLENIKTNIGKQYQRLCDRDSYITAEKVRNALEKDFESAALHDNLNFEDGLNVKSSYLLCGNSMHAEKSKYFVYSYLILSSACAPSNRKAKSGRFNGELIT